MELPDQVKLWFARLSPSDQDRAISNLVAWREARKAPGVRERQEAGDDALRALIPPSGLSEAQIVALLEEEKQCFSWMATDWKKEWSGKNMHLLSQGMRVMTGVLGSARSSVGRRLKRLTAKSQLRKEGHLFFPTDAANAPRELLNLRDTEEPYDGIRD